MLGQSTALYWKARFSGRKSEGARGRGRCWGINCGRGWRWRTSYGGSWTSRSNARLDGGWERILFRIFVKSSLLPFSSWLPPAPSTECRISSSGSRSSHRGRRKPPWTKMSPWRWSPTPSFKCVTEKFQKPKINSIHVVHYDSKQVRPVREGRRYLLWRKITG